MSNARRPDPLPEDSPLLRPSSVLTVDRIFVGKFPNAPKLRRVGVSDVAAHCCWNELHLRRKAISLGLPYANVTLLDVLPALIADKSILRQDLIHLATRSLWYEHPNVVLRWLAADFTQQHLIDARVRDPRSYATCRVVREFALGRIDCGGGVGGGGGAYAAAAYAAAALQRILFVLRGGAQ